MEGLRETNQLLVDGKYKIIKKIGSGAFGVIYKGKSTNLVKPVSHGHHKKRGGRSQVRVDQD